MSRGEASLFQPAALPGAPHILYWCVNPKTGITIEGTDVGPGKTSTCPACVASLAKALSAPAVGAYLPQCDSTGNFTPLQRHPTSLRWCVDPKTGAKVPGSERPKGQPAPACK